MQAALDRERIGTVRVGAPQTTLSVSIGRNRPPDVAVLDVHVIDVRVGR